MTYLVFKPKKLISFAAIILLLLNQKSLWAQSETLVKGQVNEVNGLPVSGASVIATNQKTNFSSGAITDSMGLFRFTKLPVGGPYSFSISIVGYEPQIMSGYTINEGADISLLIKLKPITNSLDQVVVVGYGSQKKRDITTAVVGLKAADIENQPINNVAEAMMGKLSGVQVSQGTGAPGSPLSIKVRGVGTITAGSSPLYVIDGVPISGDNINTLNNNDIASIEVLKDASSAAIYGSRGSNGVVLITTKQGKKSGKAVINVNSFVAWQEVASKIQMMDAYQYADLVLDARNNSYADQMDANNRRRVSQGLPTVGYTLNDNNGIRLANTNNNTNVIIPQEIVPYLQKQPGLINTDWQDEIFRVAPMQNHSISAAGGSDNMHYYLSLDYLNQDGIIVNSGFKRYSGRMNVEGKSGILKYGVNFSPSIITEKRVNSDGAYNSASGGGIIASALHSSPIWSVYNEDGSFNFGQNSWSGNTVTTLPNGSVVSGNAQTQAWNPVALAKLQKNDVVSNRLIGNIFTEAELMKNLRYRISVGFDIFNIKENKFRPSTIPLSNMAGNPESIATGSSSTSNEYNWLIEQTLNYNKKIGNHSFNGLLGWSTQKNDISGNDAVATSGFISNQITTLNAGIVTNGSSSHTQWALASGIGRLQYNYKGRYLLTASMRADGSSKFGSNNKWGYFPSGSIGWRLSDEQFMTDVKFVSDFKLRASYGLTGNFNIPNYAAQGGLRNYAYVFGGVAPSVINGAAPSFLPNPNLRWEKTAQLNLGFDAAFFQNLLTLSVDVYNSNTNDLLLNVPVPISTGFASNLQNIGKVNNKGIDISLGIQHQFGNIRWSANGNFSKNINTVTQLGPGNADIISTGSVANAFFLTRVGQPIGSYFLPKVIGVFKNQEEVDAYPHFVDAASNFGLASARPGDFKFLDADGDKVIDFTKDRVIVGNYLPKFTYGFSTSLEYMGFDFSALLQGVYGNKILNLSRRFFANKEGNMNNYVSSLNRWRSESEPGSGSDIRANRVGKGGNGTTSTWHVEDGSYLRIRNITIGYSLPQSICKRYSISKLRFYVAAQNPFTFTKYLGYNPEVTNRTQATTNGEDYGVYPIAKTISVGIHLTF
jgi:TonB-linked SusC/RagA family outer membrane protein